VTHSYPDRTQNFRAGTYKTKEDALEAARRLDPLHPKASKAKLGSIDNYANDTWRVRVKYQGELLHVGYFKSKDEAESKLASIITDKAFLQARYESLLQKRRDRKRKWHFVNYPHSSGPVKKPKISAGRKQQTVRRQRSPSPPPLRSSSASPDLPYLTNSGFLKKNCFETLAPLNDSFFAGSENQLPPNTYNPSDMFQFTSYDTPLPELKFPLEDLKQDKNLDDENYPPLEIPTLPFMTLPEKELTNKIVFLNFCEVYYTAIIVPKVCNGVSNDLFIYKDLLNLIQSQDPMFYEEIDNIRKNPLVTLKFSHVGAAKADLDSFMMEYENIPESLDLSVE